MKPEILFCGDTSIGFGRVVLVAHGVVVVEKKSPDAMGEMHWTDALDAHEERAVLRAAVLTIADLLPGPGP